jgi:opacity protein-like surface antigen
MKRSAPRGVMILEWMMSALARPTVSTLVSLMIAGLAAAGQARAADLLSPAPALMGTDTEQVVELGTGWYLRGDVGYVGYTNPKDFGFGLPDSQPLDRVRLDETFSLGGGIGYAFTNFLRADVTVDHRFAAEFSGTRPLITYANGYVRDQADLESTTILFNGYVDFGSFGGITPYIGAGIGLAGNRLTNISREAYAAGVLVGSGFLQPHTTNNFAWALMAGAAVNLGFGFQLDLGYRYMHLGDARTKIDGPGDGIRTDTLEAHEVRLGARYTID